MVVGGTEHGLCRSSASAKKRGIERFFEEIVKGGWNDHRGRCLQQLQSKPGMLRLRAAVAEPKNSPNSFLAEARRTQGRGGTTNSIFSRRHAEKQKPGKAFGCSSVPLSSLRLRVSAFSARERAVGCSSLPALRGLRSGQFCLDCPSWHENVSIFFFALLSLVCVLWDFSLLF
jgi:hypothetical protein